MKNKELAQIFEEMADMLEFEGEDPFKIRAYRNAARILEALTGDIEKIAGQGELQKLPGIGAKISQKIEEYLSTGRIKKHAELKEKVPPGVLELMKIPGLGAKTVKRLYDELCIVDVESLERAIEEGKLLTLPKIREKTVEKIKKGIAMYRSMSDRIHLGIALPVARRAVEFLREINSVKEVQEAGSLRRRKSTVGDIDILVASQSGPDITNAFVKAPFVRDVLARGDTKASIIVDEGVQVDVRVVAPESYGAALQYFTGSKEHNIKLRKIAGEKGWKLSEYGLFNENGKVIASHIEKEIYAALGMEFIPPEMREDRGEVELALKNELPRLVELGDIKGDFHVHTSFSDGTASPERIAEVAGKQYGYEYVGLADHSQSLKVARGLSSQDLLKKTWVIRKLNEKSSVYLIPSAEVDILPDGTLDYPDGVLEQLDIVIASVHTRFNMSVEEMTKRILAAIRHPHVHILAHPSGILLGEREGYKLDWETVFKEAASTGTALEINAYYLRLDLNDELVREALRFGVKIAIGSDAHHEDQMWMMELGVGVARRGWCEKDHVLNTWPIKKILSWAKEKRKSGLKIGKGAKR